MRQPIFAACIILSWMANLCAQPAEPKDILEQSLPLRTALHHDPALEAPLNQLVTLFRGANRLNELVTIYRNHTTQYPQDASGRTVYLRLLMASNAGDAEGVSTAAIKAFPKKIR